MSITSTPVLLVSANALCMIMMDWCRCPVSDVIYKNLRVRALCQGQSGHTVVMHSPSCAAFSNPMLQHPVRVLQAAECMFYTYLVAQWHGDDS